MEWLTKHLSGDAVAHLIFENNSWIISFVPFWLIVTDLLPGIGSFIFSGSERSRARESEERFLFPSDWLSYFCANCHYTSGWGVHIIIP
jgi:hypothetical protein